MPGYRVAELGDLLAKLAAREERREAEGAALLEELLAYPLDHQLEALDEGRFQRSEMVDALLERSRREQLRDWVLAEHLACLAVRLAFGTLGDAEQQKALVRAGVLTANARRLARRLAEAESALDSVADLAARGWEQARYLLVLGLVRWEQGRSDEGSACLEEAARLFSRAFLREEEGEALTLLGLLQAEEGLLPQSTAALLDGLELLAAPRRIGLAARGWLTLASGLAAAGCKQEGRRALNRGRGLLAAMDPSAEGTLLCGLQGSAMGALGEPEIAFLLLRTVRARHFAAAQLPEAALASLDLALALAELGLASEIEHLATELEERFRSVPAAAQAVAALRDPLWSQPAGLRARVESVGAALRRAFRKHGPRPRPLPFA